MALNWIYEDNGKVLTATAPSPGGVVFKTRPGIKPGSSRSEVWVGNTSIWGPPNVHLVWYITAPFPPDSEEAKANALIGFEEWARSVVIASGFPKRSTHDTV